MRIVPLPPNAELEKILGSLIQRPVKIRDADGLPAGPVAMGLYRTDQPVQELAVLFDLSVAASLAASLTLVPVGAVKEALAEGALEPSLRENLAEVENVLCRYISGSGRRFGLVKCWCPPEAPDEVLFKAAREADEVRMVAVEVPGYLAGRIAFNTL
jgi:HEAT repeat protein